MLKHSKGECWFLRNVCQQHVCLTKFGQRGSGFERPKTVVFAHKLPTIILVLQTAILCFSFNFGPTFVTFRNTARFPNRQNKAAHKSVQRHATDSMALVYVNGTLKPDEVLDVRSDGRRKLVPNEIGNRGLPTRVIQKVWASFDSCIIFCCVFFFDVQILVLFFKDF